MLTGAHMTTRTWQLHLIKEALMGYPSQTHPTLRACLTLTTKVIMRLPVLVDHSSLLPGEGNQSGKVRDNVMQARLSFMYTLPPHCALSVLVGNVQRQIAVNAIMLTSSHTGRQEIPWRDN